MMEDVLRDAFIKTDEEFSDSGLQAGLVGSTAVVALVGTHRVWIANCGEFLSASTCLWGLGASRCVGNAGFCDGHQQCLHKSETATTKSETGLERDRTLMSSRAVVLGGSACPPADSTFFCACR